MVDTEPYLYFSILSHSHSVSLKYPVYTGEPSVGWEMSSSLKATGWRVSVANWGSGMPASCTAGSILFAGVGNGWPHIVLRYH